MTATPLATFFGPTDTTSGFVPNPWVSFTSANLIGSSLTAGVTYEIAAIESEATGPINFGVDNFSLIATGSSLATPEPSMFFPVSLMAGFLVYYSRRKAGART